MTTPISPPTDDRFEFAHATNLQDGETPIEDYAIIGDTNTVALISPTGAIDWLCLPNIDHPSLFNRLLDRERGGFFEIGMDAPVMNESYVAGAPILRQRYQRGRDILEVTDFLSVPPANDQHAPQREVIRLARARRGEPVLRCRFEPRPGNAERRFTVRRSGKKSWIIRTGSEILLLQSDMPLGLSGDTGLSGEERLSEGESRYFRLSFERRGILPVPARSSLPRRYRSTLRFWKQALAMPRYRGPYAKPVERSAMFLRLLTFSQSGAVAAAGTTSLPEVIGGERNWDYRFCWPRDASFLLRACGGLGMKNVAAAFYDWVVHSTQLTAPDLASCYDTFGRRRLDEKLVPGLSGYRGSAPVRVGNSAVHQQQLDVYGSVLEAAVIQHEHGVSFDPFERRRLRSFADRVIALWREKDSGIWEYRSVAQHHTYSKAMCWSALMAAARLARDGVLERDAAPYEDEARTIRTTIFNRAWNEGLGAFQGAFDTAYLDASLLLLPRIGIIDADDPRMVSTFHAIDARLSDGVYIRRYDTSVDQWASDENAFVACGFWAVEYLAMSGRLGEARRRMDQLVRDGGRLGALSEQIDPGSGGLRGNIPQAFSHAALINAALAIGSAERDGRQA